MVETRIEVLPDITDLVDFFVAVPEYDIAMYTHKKMKTNPEISLEVLEKILPVLEETEDYSNDAMYGFSVDSQKKMVIRTDRFYGQFVLHFLENR